MNTFKSSLTGILLGLAITNVAVAAPSRAAASSDDDTPATKAELAKLQAEVREQRTLIIQMLQTEQQRYDMLLRLLQGQGGNIPMPQLPSATAAATETEDAPAKRGGRGGEVERKPQPGAIEGKVTVAGGDVGEIYVYVENLKGPPGKAKSIEIKQEGKQFSPRVAVVQTGTTVVFPNFDTIYHNVFSNSPRNSFDLGSYRAGEKPRSVMLTASGVVDVFCNMHQKMSASILVVPNAYYTKVRADGTFRLENVPPGQRRVVAWGPNAKPAHQKVDVNGGSTQATFALEREDRAAHANKLGQAYGSYRD